MNLSDRRKPAILIAEDDADDRLLLEVAFDGFDDSFELRFVQNGEELMEYLHHRGEYAKSMPPKPGLILLDLNMPKKDGRQCLKEIKSDARLQEIPVVVWTTSNLEEDIARCTEAGADSYITKPASYPGLLDAVREIGRKWFPGSAREGSGVATCDREMQTPPLQKCGGMRRGWDLTIRSK